MGASAMLRSVISRPVAAVSPRLSVACSTKVAASAQAANANLHGNFPYRQESTVTNKTLQRNRDGKPIDRKHRSLFHTSAVQLNGATKDTYGEKKTLKEGAFPARQHSTVTNKTQQRNREGKPIDRKTRSLFHTSAVQ